MQQLVKTLQSDSNSLSEKQSSVQNFLHAFEQERKKEFGEIQALFQVLQNENKAAWEKQLSIHEFVMAAEQKRQKDTDHMKDMLQALQNNNVGMLEKQRVMEAFLQSADNDRRQDVEHVQRLLQVLQNENVATLEKQRSIQEFLAVADQERKRDSIQIKKQLDAMHQSEKHGLESIQRQLEQVAELLMKRSVSPTMVVQPTAASSNTHSDRDFSFFIEPEHIEYEVDFKKSQRDNRVKIGHGGFGTVYKAKLRRALVVAVKVVDDSAHSKATIEELMREIRIMSRLSHRNIIGFYGGFYPLQPHNIGYGEEEAYLVMELAENGSLAHQLFRDNGTPIPIAKKIEILSGVADGLCYLHFRNIVHRDIKPDNVLLDRELVPKLSDFGLAKVKETSLSSRSPENGGVGTPGYQSPETMQSEKTSFSADIWSFGIMMIDCMLDGRMFAGMNATQISTMVCVNKKVPLEKMEPHKSHWPKEYVELIHFCLRFDMNRRPTAMDLSVVMRAMMEKSAAQKDHRSSLYGLQMSARPDSRNSGSLMSSSDAASILSMSTVTLGSSSGCLNIVTRKLSAREIEDLFRRGKEFYLGCNGIEIDYPQAVECFRQAAEQGHAEAQYNLGICYGNGRGVPQKFEQAVELYKLAAKQGNAKAQFNLGACYHKGRGVTQDHKQAFDCYRLAANQGHAGAQNWLGHCYENGQGVTQDYKQAVEWYQKAAKQENVWAQTNLGDCYKKGHGVTQDYEKAIEWYRSAADRGNSGGQCGLADCYKNGWGVAQDDTKAIELYQLAAKQGDANAQFNLGACYANGQGVAKDLAEAKKWYKLAEDQEHEDAKNRCPA